MRTDFVNIDRLKKNGSAFLRLEDEKKIIRAFKILDSISVGGDLPVLQGPDAEKILKEFWTEYAKGYPFMAKKYNTSQEKRRLLSVLNNDFNGQKITTSPALTQVLDLFQNDNSELTINRWMYNLMKGWEEITLIRENFDAIRFFISSKLKQSKKKLHKTRILAENEKYFLRINGPQHFAEDGINHNLSQEEHCEYLGIRYNSLISYHSFVDEEIFKFQLKTKKFPLCANFITSIRQNPNQYSVRIKKKLVSLFIIAVEQNNLDEYKELAKETAFNDDVIGDPEDLSKWSIRVGGTQKDKEKLELAREILNKWLLGVFVEVFFHKLIDDPKRKAYWLEKLPLINSVRVYGSDEAKYKLLQDERIKQFVTTERFNEVQVSGSNSGIRMSIGNYHIIEFTDTGALYCYLKESNLLPRNINSLSQLKNTNMHLASSPGESKSDTIKWLEGRNLYLNIEGRIVHNPQDGEVRNGRLIKRDGWMKRTDVWLNTYAK